MRKLAVDFEQIAMAMEDQDEFNSYYLDTHTGELVAIPSEYFSLEVFDEEGISELSDWERELIHIAQEIQEGSERYEPVPRVQPYEIYNLMVEFTETVSDRRLREKLDIALDGKGAFGRFKRVLADYPQERERWFAYKLAAMSEWIREWLNDLEIEPLPKKVGEWAVTAIAVGLNPFLEVGAQKK